MTPVEVLKISYHPESRSYAVILKEISGDICLPVIVGSYEAQSIALAIAIGLKPQLVEIKPKWFPRIFPVLFAGRFGILLSDKDNFLLSSENQIVITCGRRMIGINIGIKRLAKKKSINSLNIQIQSPKKFVPYFDILISVVFLDPAIKGFFLGKIRPLLFSFLTRISFSTISVSVLAIGFGNGLSTSINNFFCFS